MEIRKQAVVLDFDGTIADAEDVLLKVYDPLAKKYGWPKLTRRDYYRLRKGNPRDIMRWANVKIWQIPKLLKVGRREYKKHIGDVRLFDGMPAVIDRLSKDTDVYILSSNDRETVRKILARNKIRTRLTILHGSSLFSKDKALKKLLKRGYLANDSWMIGDEIRDIQAGKKTRMKTIGVTWGLQSEQALRSISPDYIAKKPGDILKFLYNKDQTVGDNNQRSQN
ncbi:MAG TPA: HAD hydrolase-like protein [Candidatus Saccharimonadales bacterium]|nr:HAD hydrolase-like protein [Candidatus Saccharimonadales bacterium]